MDSHQQQHRVIACARQIMDVPEEDEPLAENGAVSLAWFAFGHAAILLYLALHMLTRLG
jgi:hypothetical protein